MKKYITKTCILIISSLMMLTISGCSKENSKTCSLNINLSLLDKCYENQVIAFEYSEYGDKIGNHTFKNFKNKSTQKFNVNNNAEKIKIYISYTSASPFFDDGAKWVQQVYYLDETDTQIIINDNTLCGNYEP